MEAVLPGFVGRLLAQSRDPSHIPDITVLAASDWLSPLASRVLHLLDTGTYRATGSFLAHGYAYLPLKTPEECTVYLRVSDTRALTFWPVHAPTAVLNMAGTTVMEMYREPDDEQEGRPQYARTLGTGEFFAAHPGALCATGGTVSTVQVLATSEPVTDREGLLSGEAYAAFAQRGRRYLEQASRTLVGAPC
ncbi:hypothetical protein [Streptomyces sp. NPDC003480]